MKRETEKWLQSLSYKTDTPNKRWVSHINGLPVTKSNLIPTLVDLWIDAKSGRHDVLRDVVRLTPLEVYNASRRAIMARSEASQIGSSSQAKEGDR